MIMNKIKNYISIQSGIWVATIINFILFGLIQYATILFWLNPKKCGKCDVISYPHYAWTHYQEAAIIVCSMVIGWLVFCRFPKLGIFIELIPVYFVILLLCSAIFGF